LYKFEHAEEEEESSPIYATLHGLTNHLASQLRATVSLREEEEWIHALVKTSLLDFIHDDKKPLQTILATCTVWHGIHYWDCSVATRAVFTIGQILQDLYNDKMEVFSVPFNNWQNVLGVNLLHLLEAIIAMRVQVVPNLMEELQQALGSELVLAVPICDTAFLHTQEVDKGDGLLWTGGTKLILRACLYDLVQKVSLVQQQQNDGISGSQM